MRFFHFAYMSNRTDEFFHLRPHQLRDGDAFAELLEGLNCLGHEYGGLVINHPVDHEKSTDDSLAFGQQFREDDLFVLATRPPLNDVTSKDPKPVRQSPSDLEECLFKAVREYIVISKRDHIQLHPEQARHLRPNYRDRADIAFFVKGHERLQRFEASYRGSGSGDKTFAGYNANTTTAAYLIHTPPNQIPGHKRGPRLLVAFGMSGTVSLVFAYMLRRATVRAKSADSGTTKSESSGMFAWDLLSHILKAPSFAMVEISITKKIPDRFYNLDFADTWHYELLVTL